MGGNKKKENDSITMMEKQLKQSERNFTNFNNSNYTGIRKNERHQCVGKAMEAISFHQEEITRRYDTFE